MKRHRKFLLSALLVAAAFVLGSCGGSGASNSAQQENEATSGGEQEETTGGMQGMSQGEMTGMDMGSGSEAPAMLIQNGEYSDERFIDMIAAHHQMAIEMAQVEQENGQIPELQQIANDIVSSQQQEIEELRSIKEEEFGSSELPTMMNSEDQMMYAMTMPNELEQQASVDLEFIDSMLPHHSSAIELASIARMRSDNPNIQRIARNIIDEQSREIGEQIQIRQQNFPESQ